MELIAALAARTQRAVDHALRGQRRIALVNFPNHGNAGDPALWLGGLIALRRAGATVVYVCDPESYDPMAVRRRLGPSPTVVISGGGNLGDRYWRQQRARERVLEDFPGGRFVQLPQSIEFRDEAERDRVATLMRDRDLVLMVREPQSVERATSMGLDPVHVPDTSFLLGPLAPPPAPRSDVVWQQRTDAEHVDGSLDPSLLFGDGTDVEVVDWLGDLGDDEEPRTPVERVARWAERRAAEADSGPFHRAGPSVRRLAYPRLAHHWVRRGTTVLGRGRVVVTDRLHGHILSLLCGIPHVSLDNATGKVHQTLEAWTGGHPSVTAAGSAEEAAAVALDLLRRSGESSA